MNLLTRGERALTGSKLRSLRRARRLTQHALAGALQISPSYLNLLEHNRRNLTAPLLLRIARYFEISLYELSETDELQLLAELDAALRKRGHVFADGKLIQLATEFPEFARLWLNDAAQGEAGENASGQETPWQIRLSGVSPIRAVEDYINQRRNFFPDLEQAAERMRSTYHFDSTTLSFESICRTLQKKFRIMVKHLPSQAMPDLLRSYDQKRRIIMLSAQSPLSTRRFQAAYQLCQLSEKVILDTLTAESPFTAGQTGQRTLLRQCLTNYLTAALLMPYDRFLNDSRNAGYDLEWLQMNYAVSFEQLCHRLCSLNDPANAGIPMHMLRIDPAGNISKRFSISGFELPRFENGCVRLDVYRCFTRPNVLSTQHVITDDGQRYLMLSRAFTKGHVGYGSARISRAILIGCTITEAHATIYYDSLNLEHPTHVGSSCRSCERHSCAQRVAPHACRRFQPDPDFRVLSPYALAEDLPGKEI